jgi:hypothetical protein
MMRPLDRESTERDGSLLAAPDQGAWHHINDLRRRPSTNYLALMALSAGVNSLPPCTTTVAGSESRELNIYVNCFLSGYS